MNEPAIDLGIVLAIISSYRENPINEEDDLFRRSGLKRRSACRQYGRQRVTEAKNLDLMNAFCQGQPGFHEGQWICAKGNPPDWCEVSERCDGCDIEIKYGGNISFLER